MSLFDIFRKDKVEIGAAPITINITGKEQFKRNVSRLVNLYAALEAGDPRKGIVDEIEARKKACVEFGHEAPSNLEEALTLKQRIEL